MILRLLLMTSLWGMCIAGLQAQANRDCRRFPAFTQKLGYDPNRSYLSTSERTIMGLVYIEKSDNPNKKSRYWQYPSWKYAGWLGPMIITETGEIWVAPVPSVNLLHNKPEDQNKLWHVDAQTGTMTVAMEIPKPDSGQAGRSPYGLMGLGYDCDTKVMYATSVYGSSPEAELGKIVAIQLPELKIIAQIDSIDAFGAGTVEINGKKSLYVGSARNGDVWAISLDDKGAFASPPEVVLSLNNMGPRGDDRARKIRMGADGVLTIQGVEFYYNLTAPTEKQETTYQFRFDAARGWLLVGLR